MALDNGPGKDQSVVMVWRQGCETSINFIAQTADAKVFHAELLAKEPESPAPPVSDDQGAKDEWERKLRQHQRICWEHRQHVCELRTSPTDQGRRTLFCIRRSEVACVAIDRHTGVVLA